MNSTKNKSMSNRLQNLKVGDPCYIYVQPPWKGMAGYHTSVVKAVKKTVIVAAFREESISFMKNSSVERSKPYHYTSRRIIPRDAEGDAEVREDYLLAENFKARTEVRNAAVNVMSKGVYIPTEDLLKLARRIRKVLQ